MTINASLLVNIYWILKWLPLNWSRNWVFFLNKVFILSGVGSKRVLTHFNRKNSYFSILALGEKKNPQMCWFDKLKLLKSLQVSKSLQCRYELLTHKLHSVPSVIYGFLRPGAVLVLNPRGCCSGRADSGWFPA